MNETQLFAHFDRISEAPGSTLRLRRFILDLAVRGKLVEQDPKDEPASALPLCPSLVSIVRDNLDGSPPTPKDDDHPFEVPSGWAWSRLGDVCSKTGSGSTPRGGKSVYQATGVPFLRSQNVYDDGLRLDDVAFITNDTHQRMSGTAVQSDDLLLNITGGSIGRCCLVPRGLGDANVSQHVAIIRTAIDGIQGYLHVLIRSPYFQQFVNDEQTGAGRGGLPKNRMDRIPIALPPLAEQRRIVAKVDELMMLCDRFEAAQVAREKRRTTLVASSNYHLTDATDNNEFRTHARVFLRHLPELTFHKEDVRLLRETIATLAIKGRLVHQEYADEPADELLARIRAEKARQGISHDGKQLRPDSDAGIFAIPLGWRWITLGEIAFEFRYGTSVKCSYESTGESVLRIPNIKNGRIDIEDLKFGPLGKREADDLRLQLDDILMVRSNGSLNLVGRAALVEAHAVGYCYAGYLVRMRTSPAIYSPYILLALNSAHVRRQIEIPIRTTVGLKNVNATELSRLSLPLPPLAEQRRIVAKVNELMRICDKLEVQQSATITEAGRLLESVLHDALHMIHKREVAAIPELASCR